jgi:hypothetical protein
MVGPGKNRPKSAVPPPQPGPQGKADPRHHYPQKAAATAPAAVDSEMGQHLTLALQNDGPRSACAFLVQNHLIIAATREHRCNAEEN